jgi:hypothetical protein
MPAPGAIETSTDCPAAGETDEDCPWAGVARQLRAEESNSDAKARIQSKLGKLLPNLHDAIVSSQRIGGRDLRYIDLWGRSSNYDVSQLNLATPKPTVDEPILDAFNDLAGLGDARHGDLGTVRGAITFAGIEHTYGYLFSLLPTPFGFKRARWVRDDLEAGFGFSRGTLGPLPKAGSLFANVTYFSGKIAFRSDLDKRELAAIEEGGDAVSQELRSFDFQTLTPVRVEETVNVPARDGSPGHTVVLQTDFVSFTVRRTAPDGNTNLLLYSIRDLGERRTRLISAFPVNDATRSGALAQEKLGDDKALTTQFNAFVDAITNASSALRGTRHVLRGDGTRCDADCR